MTEVFDDVLYDENTKYKDDEKLIVAFYSRPVKNNFKSDQEGRPIFEDVDFIKIIIPGSRDVTDTKATEAYKSRFPRQWASYKNKQQGKEAAIGTPLSELSWMGASVVAEFNAFNVFTVEQLLNLPDVHASKFMGIHQIRERAKRFMDAAAGEAPAMKLEKQVAELAAENKRLKEHQAELQAKVKVLEGMVNAPKPVATK